MGHARGATSPASGNCVGVCELLAICAKNPIEATRVLRTFRSHGGAEWGNQDGWGLAFHNGAAAQVYKQPRPMIDAPLADAVIDLNIQAPTIIGHIRAKTEGARDRANTQPFRRVRGGKTHVFAHNGGVPDFAASPEGQRACDLAVGTTDSEVAMIELLIRLGVYFETHDPGHDAELKFSIFHTFARAMADYGPFNCLYADGDNLFAHSDRRAHHADGEDADLRGPGLYVHQSECVILSSEPLEGTAADGVPRGTSLWVGGGDIAARRSAP